MIYSKLIAATSGHSVTLVTGNFNAFHLGHVRLIEYARSFGGKLVVGIHGDRMEGVEAPLNERKTLVERSGLADIIFEIESSTLELIQTIQPDVVVKGIEHYQQHDPAEAQVIHSYGGRLFFAAGPLHANPTDKTEISNIALDIFDPGEFLARHRVTNNTNRSIQAFKGLKVAVIGDIIIDEYVACEALGMSQEDPTIVVAPKGKKRFLGGASIVAAHMGSLGANVKFFSVGGDNQDSEWVVNELKNFGVCTHLTRLPDAGPVVKRRYKVEKKTMFRLNKINNKFSDPKLVDRIYKNISKFIKEIDLVVISDFSYGAVHQSLVTRVLDLCKANDVFVAADSQTSSQTGDISKFANVDLITPTELEARAAFNNIDDSLTVMVDHLYEKLYIKNIFVTLGAHGVFIQQNDDSSSLGPRSDQIPALNKSVVDVAGAGDVFLAVSSMCLASGDSPWQAAYVGSIAAAVQVSRLGNIPLTIEEIMEFAPK
ncbi:PfkB family carbohydrate kinase [Alphaproteobacteria bacterium]|nr:PfkB family carbohydrate kinase [Alphaproteobacteria bacterium]